MYKPLEPVKSQFELLDEHKKLPPIYGSISNVLIVTLPFFAPTLTLVSICMFIVVFLLFFHNQSYLVRPSPITLVLLAVVMLVLLIISWPFIGAVSETSSTGSLESSLSHDKQEERVQPQTSSSVPQWFLSIEQNGNNQRFPLSTSRPLYIRLEPCCEVVEEWQHFSANPWIKLTLHEDKLHLQRIGAAHSGHEVFVQDADGKYSVLNFNSQVKVPKTFLIQSDGTPVATMKIFQSSQYDS